MLIGVPRKYLKCIMLRDYCITVRCFVLYYYSLPNASFMSILGQLCYFIMFVVHTSVDVIILEFFKSGLFWFLVNKGFELILPSDICHVLIAC